MNTEAIRTDWVGRVVDARFRLLEWLGSSGQSSVFLCEIGGDREQKAAIKLFPADAETAQTCESNWAAAAGLIHPHLIRVLHTGRDRIEDTELLYVVTEYAGEILAEILPVRPLTPAEVKEMLGPTLDALAFLHEKGFAHCRLKPSNILVVDDQLKLSVENIRRSAATTRPPDTLEIYDAPERSLGKVSPACDIWSLGVVIVEALTRIPPFWSSSSTNDPNVPVSVPAPYKQIAQECLRVDPGLRCTLGEIRSCLQPQAPFPPPAANDVQTVKNLRKPPRKGRVAILAACAVVLLAVFAFLMVRWHQTAPSTSGATQPPETSTPAPQQTAAQPEASSSQQAEAPSPAPEQNTVPARQEPPVETAPQAVPGPVVQGPALKGVVTHQVAPDVPEKAMGTIQGTVQVSIQLNVNADGTISDASIASQGQGRYFADLALKAARSWTFKPATVNGRGVDSVWLLKFAFHRSGIDVTSAEESP